MLVAQRKPTRLDPPESAPASMMRCGACRQLEEAFVAPEPHAALVAERSESRRLTSGLGQIRWDYYRCEDCSSRWVRQSDDLGCHWFEP